MAFSASLNDLKHIVSLYLKNRDSRQEVRMVEQQGGSKYFMHGLTSHVKKGIRKGSIDHRMEVYGKNELNKLNPPPFFRLLYQSFKNWITILLTIVCIATLIIDFTTTNLTSKHKTSWVESLSILIAIIICCITSAVNDYYKEIEFNKLHNFELQRKAGAVIRENDTVEVPLQNIVVGDVLMIVEGMIVPVDAWLVEGYGIVVDQSHVIEGNQNVRKETIEKIQIADKGRQNPNNLISPVLINGTRILSGQGKAVVVLIGKHLTNIPDPIEVEKKSTATPLKQNLQKLTYNISVFGVISAIIVLVGFVIRFIVYKFNEEGWSTDDLQVIFRFILLSVTLIMVSVPEGLPLSVSLSLGHSLKKMLQDNNLVQDLEAYEKMGEVAMICTGKSGLVTQNKMDVMLWWNQQTFDVGQDFEMPIRTSLHQNFKELFLINLFVNSSADIKNKNYGSPTEVGLMRFGERFNQTYGDYRMNYNVLEKLSFNSVRKRTSIVVQYEGERYMFTKGAGEILLQQCTHYHNKNEKTFSLLTSEDKKCLENQVKQFTTRGLRIITLAYRKIGNQSIQDGELDNLHPLEQQNLVLQSLVGIYDPSRDQLKECVKQCHQAGIDVKMITGENLNSAISLAKEVGIIQPDRPSLCLEGEQFELMIGGLICEKCRIQKCSCVEEGLDRKDVIKNIEDFDRIVRRLDVLARVRPNDKQILMAGLQNKGVVVAATGSKRSDTIMMKYVDVSFSMGVNGTDISRACSSVILIDDNFNSIIKSVQMGRNIYDALRKFIQFQLTVNGVAVIFTIVGVVFLDQEPLSPIQLIWVNMIMDTLASLALSTQQPSPTLLDRRPNNKNQSIINNRMWKHIISQALFQIIILVGLLFFGQYFIPEYADDFDSQLGQNWNLKYHLANKNTVRSGRLYQVLSTDPDYMPIYQTLGFTSRHITFIFNTFVFFQIFNFFNCRKLYDELNVFSGLLSNPLFCIVVGGTMIIQVLIVTFGSTAFELYPFYGLKALQWVMSIGIGASSLLVGILIKMLPESEQEDAIGERRKKVNRSGKLALRSKEFDSDEEQSSSNNI